MFLALLCGRVPQDRHNDRMRPSSQGSHGKRHRAAPVRSHHRPRPARRPCTRVSAKCGLVSRLFDDDDDDFVERPERVRMEALADLNQAFFAREVAAWTQGHRSVTEIGIGLLRHWLAPEEPPATITHSEVLGVMPLEVTDALLDTLRTQ